MTLANIWGSGGKGESFFSPSGNGRLEQGFKKDASAKGSLKEREEFHKQGRDGTLA